MSTYRIGVITDTHIPEFLPALPPGVEHIFQGIDLILHAGDVTGTQVLEQLQHIAPVVAVKGNHDKLDLPHKKVVEVADVRIGLIHGHRPRWQEAPGTLYNMLYPSRFSWGSIHARLLRNFERVNAIVFGHFHLPCIEWQNGILLFSPGAIYQVTPENVADRLATARTPWLRLYLRHALRRKAISPSVGLLTIQNGVIHPEIISVE